MRPLTRSCFLPLLLEMLLLLTFYPPWNLPSFTVKSILSSPCSCSDPPLSHQGAALSHFDSLPPDDLVMWTDGSVPFRFWQKRLWPRRQLLTLWQVFPLQPAPLCKLSAGLGSINKAATSLLLLFDSRSVLSSVFPFISNSLENLAETVLSLLLYYQITTGPGHLFRRCIWCVGQAGSATLIFCNPL